MKYTKAQRQNFADSLIRAKRRLSTGTWSHEDDLKCTFICNALGFDSTVNDLIMHRLRLSPGAPRCVREFLRSIGVPQSQLTHKNVQEYRHRWVDALIEEFSK